MLLSGGIWTGGLVTYAVERVSLWRRMPLEEYVVDLRRSLSRADPFQPVIGFVCVAGAVVFALSESGTSETLTWLGTGLVAAVIVWSVVLLGPLNSRVTQLPEGHCAPGGR